MNCDPWNVIRFKVVSAKYKGNDQFFALATHGGRFFAVSEACGRCKFPMVSATTVMWYCTVCARVVSG